MHVLLCVTVARALTLVAYMSGSNYGVPPPSALLSTHTPPQVVSINRDAFTVAHAEWKKLQLETRMHVGQLNDLVCPACVPGERSLHGDGNQKLSTWARDRQASREPYYQDVLFVSADLVDKDMKAVDKVLGKEVGGWWALAACVARVVQHNTPTFHWLVLRLDALFCLHTATAFNPASILWQPLLLARFVDTFIATWDSMSPPVQVWCNTPATTACDPASVL